MNDETAIERVNNEVRLQQCLQVMSARIQRSLTVEEACAEINLPTRTYYQWISEGTLDDYLIECKNARHQEASVMANEAVPAVMSYQIRLATGIESARGASPVAAAKLVLAAAAGIIEGFGEEERPGDKRPVAQFFPQSITFVLGDRGLQPVDVSDSIIEGEVEEITESGEDGA